MADEAGRIAEAVAVALAEARAASAAALAERDAAAARAAETAARAAREAAAREEGLKARLESLLLERTGAAAGAAGAAGAAAGGGAAATAVPSQLSMPLVAHPSPTDAKTNFIDGVFCAFVERPVAAATLGLAPPAPSIGRAFASLFAGAVGDALAIEANFYARALRPLPRFAERVGEPTGQIEATALFTERGLVTRAWALTGGCFPELHVRAAVSAARPFRPGFNGEVRSVGATWLEQAVYYTAMDMVRVFFPAGEPAAPGPRRFFAKPPAGFALVAFPHVGYFVALEWVGVLFVSPATAPFIIGSEEHEAAAAALPDVEYTPPELLDGGLQWLTWPRQPSPRRGAPAAAAAAPPPPPHESVSWCVAGGRFRKVVRADARSPARFRALHRAYARLAELAPAAGAPGAPRALAAVARGVRMLYGAHEVLIETAALGGARDAHDAEVWSAGPVLEAAAAAVAWLARRGLLYTDLRGPNVLVAGDEVWLVDFDDCVALDEPVRDAGGFRAALLASGAAAAGAWASALVRDTLPSVHAALAAAFDAAGESEA